MRLAALLLLAGCSSHAPERFARSLTFSGWTYDTDSSASGAASRITPTGGIGSQGLLETSGSGEGWGAGVTLSLDKMLGPEVQPIRIEREDLRDVRMELASPLPQVTAPQPKKRGRVPVQAQWAAGLTAALGLAEAISRKLGKGGVVMPACRKAKALLSKTAGEA